MSFSFNAAGSPKAVIAAVGQQAASLEQVPTGFADAINQQLSGLPEDAEVTLVCYGHTGWHVGQTAGQINLHAALDVRVAHAAAVAQIGDTAPEAQPGPERFPDGFTGDPPAGPAAGEPDPS